MVLGQLGVWKRSFIEQFLLRNAKLWNACNNVMRFTIVVHHGKVQFRPLVDHNFLNQSLFTPKKLVLCHENNKIKIPKNTHKQVVQMYILKELNVTNSMQYEFITHLPSQSNESEQNGTSVHIPCIHEIWCKILEFKHLSSSWFGNDKCKSPYNKCATCSNRDLPHLQKPFTFKNLHWNNCDQDLHKKLVFHHPLSSKSNCAKKYGVSTSKIHKLIYQFDHKNYSSSVEGKDAQSNNPNNSGEVAKKAQEEAKAKRAKAINDDHLQTIAQLEMLKSQVKKVHEEMQARKHESWTIKFGKFAHGVVGFITQIGPTIARILSMSKKDWSIKIDGWKKIIKLEAQHYYIGGKLLWADIKISARLFYKVLQGKNLRRRERQQLKLTTGDIFQLIPFAVTLVVPFMEFTLPFLLKIFPNMLPSTFADKNKQQENVDTKLVARVQYAKFLKETVQDMAKELKKSPSGKLRRTADDLENFMNKVHTGGDIKNKEIIAFAKLFNDELTLDNISRIKNDDIEIEKEGIDTLSEYELQAACRERGMLGIQSVDQMREQLRDWLELSITHKVPSSLLILSRAFLVAGKTDSMTAVEATLSSLPYEVIASVDVSTKASELELEERKKRLEVIQQQEELIKKGK